MFVGINIIFAILPVIIFFAIAATVIVSVVRKIKNIGKQILSGEEKFPEIIFPTNKNVEEEVEESEIVSDNELEKKRLELETLKMQREIQEAENKKIKCDYCGTINKAKNEQCSGCGARIK